LRQFSGGEQFRLFSIDGDHEHYHVTRDITTIASSLAHGGIVIIDDYTNPGWPGVAEGVARHFLLSSHQPLAPIFIGSNKLLLTTASCHNQINSALLDFFVSNSLPCKVKSLFGYSVIVQEGSLFSVVP